MTKPNKQRAGLQKKVSSVFKGVSIPGHKHPDDPSKATGGGHEAIPQDAMQDHGLPLHVSQGREISRSDGLASQIGAAGAGTQEPPISTKAKDSDGPVLEKQMRPEDPASKAVPDLSASSSEPISEGTQLLPISAEAKSGSVEAAGEQQTTKRFAESPARVSDEPQTAHSPLMKKLAQADEREQKPVNSTSISTEPGGVRNQAEKCHDRSAKPAEQEVAKEPKESARPVSTDRNASPGSLVKRLAQSEDSENEALLETIAETPRQLSPSRKTSPKQEIRSAGQNEASATRTVQPGRTLPDSFIDDDVEDGVLNQLKDKLLPSSEDGNSKDKVMLMLVPVLAIVMIFLFRNVLWKSPGKAKADTQKDKPAAALVDKSNEIEWKIPDPLPAMSRNPLKLPEQDDPESADQVAALNSGPDATISQAQTQVAAGALDIRAIVYSQDKASAIVAGQIVYAGSNINGVNVVRINRDSVELEKDGRTWVQRVRD